MATVYENAGSKKPLEVDASYTGYTEPDTKIPPKAKAVLNEVSVNGVAIPEADILAEAQHHPAKNPGEALGAAARALVVRELLLQEANRLSIAPQSGKAVGGEVETKDDAAISALIEKEVSTPFSTKQECLRYYKQNSGKFFSETIYEVRHILLALAGNEDVVARQSAKDSAKRIIKHLEKTPSDFSNLVNMHSACSSREQKGNLGQITKGSTVKEFESAIENMAVGTISSEPVKSAFGYHVIALDNKIDGKLLPFDVVKDQISAWLEASSWSRAVSQYISILAGEAKIKGVEINAATSPLLQ